MIHKGLGGTVRRESAEYEAALDGAFNAGRDARINQVEFKKALQGVPSHLRMEFKRGYESNCK